MRRTIAVLVLVLALLVPVQAKSIGEILFGSDPKLRQAPYNSLEIGLLYRDTVEPCPYPEPMTYHLQEKDGSFSSVIPDVSMPVPITGRPVMAVVGGLIMTGQKIGRIYPAADIPIKVIVPSFNGWEDQGEWLFDAIKQARICAGLESDLSRLPSNERSKAREIARLEARQRGEYNRNDPGAFPPFICLPADTQPKVNPDGSITFGRPPMSLPLMIVAPVSNLILGSAHSISLLVSINKNSFAGAVIGFKTARPDTFKVPNSALSQPQTQVATQPEIQQYVAPAPQAQVVPQAPQYTAPTQPAPVYQGSVPSQIVEWTDCLTSRPKDKPWWQPCYYAAPPSWTPGLTHVVCFFVRSDRSIVTAAPNIPDVGVEVDGNPLAGSPFYLNDGIRGNYRNGVLYIKRPYPGGKMSVTYQGRRWSFSIGGPDQITWQPLNY
ncbi:MAG: hypothetical protein Q7T05_02660 [Dehalococcoidia bacterium]|nr:hypothetical protein [Dehalococcoidia bacterium]